MLLGGSVQVWRAAHPHSTMEDISMSNHRLRAFLRIALAPFEAMLSVCARFNRIASYSAKAWHVETRAAFQWDNHDGADSSPPEAVIGQHSVEHDHNAHSFSRPSHSKASVLDPAATLASGHVLDGLPANTVEIFLLNQRDGRSYKEISDLLGLSQRRVRQHMRRAIAHIAARR